MAQNLPLTDLGNKLVQLINSGSSHDYSRFKVELSVEKAVKDGNLLPSLYRKQPEETLELVSYLIVDFANSINVGKNISDPQVDDIACILCTKFKDLKLEELVIIFTNAKAGLYGKIYDRLDIVIISEYIAKYQAGEKADYLEKTNHYSSFATNSVLDALVNSEIPDNPKVQELQKTLYNIATNSKISNDKSYSVTAFIPKDSEYLAQARIALPEFNLEELQKYKKYAEVSGWPDLIELVDAELLKRSESKIKSKIKTKTKKNKNITK